MDLFLEENGDGGEFVLEGGDIKTDGTLLTALYISLFNGDAFYNIYETYKTDDSFEKALNQTISLNNLKEIEKAGKKLTSWMIDEGLAEDVVFEATGDIQAKINVKITITEPGEVSSAFAVVWENEKYILKAL